MSTCVAADHLANTLELLVTSLQTPEAAATLENKPTTHEKFMTILCCHAQQLTLPNQYMRGKSRREQGQLCVYTTLGVTVSEV